MIPLSILDLAPISAITGRDFQMLIGRDVLTKCSRIEMDKPGRQWVLTCNFGAS